MDIAYLCVLIAVLLPYVWVGYAKFSTSGYNNNQPREFLQTLGGKAKRAHYAHLNAFEAFAPFAAGVVIAHLANVSSSVIDSLSLSFIVFRLFHGVFYILDQPSFRSLVWIGGFGCVVTLFILSIFK